MLVFQHWPNLTKLGLGYQDYLRMISGFVVTKDPCVCEELRSFCGTYNILSGLLQCQCYVGRWHVQFIPIWIFFFYTEYGFMLIQQFIVDAHLQPYVTCQWVDDFIEEILENGLAWLN